MRKKSKNKIICLGYLFLFILFSVTVTCYWGLKWYLSTYHVKFAEFIFTILSPMKGTGGDSVRDGVIYCCPRIAFCIFVFGLAYVFITPNKFSKKLLNLCYLKKWEKSLYISSYVVLSLLVVGAFVKILHSAYFQMGIDQFVKQRSEKTLIYENEYVPPKNQVSLNGKPRNLIHIIMESMESSYASMDVGGCLETNLIPSLTSMALENESFSKKGSIGGYYPTTLSSWTVASILSQHAGIPFSFPIDGNLMNERRSFASGVTTLGDILKDYNYNQAFVCGSDADFGGRKSFFEQHGDYKIYDYNTALASNAIPEGYKVWWGFEDEYLYKIAESELALLSESDKPFNLTLLTVDTHHKYGYICGNCNSNYLDRTSNVIDCADRQVANFIKWIKSQPFYDNTTIVITGDHRRMDDALRSEYKNNKRKVYCTIINSPVKPKLIYHERVFSSLDVFPTIVASLGFTIKDNRLGLGVNLYSEKPTLIEQMGFEKLDGELSKHSDYYFKNFP